MSVISRGTLPQNFLDSASTGMRLPTPEPQYFFAKMAMAGRLSLAALDVGAPTAQQFVTMAGGGQPIPPTLDEHPEGGRAPVSYRGPDLTRAKRLLAEAGHPDGRGLPPLKFYTSIGSQNQQMSEMLKGQLGRIGIRVEVNLVDFSQLIEFVNSKKAPFFGFAWGSDYPDAENNLALFYGPNESPGSNHFNYKRPEYDALYEQILTMEPGEERTAVYERMRDMVIEDVPFIGSQARTRFYLIAPWLENARPTERYYGWFKFLDVDPTKMKR